MRDLADELGGCVTDELAAVGLNTGDRRGSVVTPDRAGDALLETDVGQ